MEDYVRVKIIGAGGYGGIGTIELLQRHPDAQVVSLIDVQGEGPISAMWPHLEGVCDLEICSPGSPEADVECDVVFFCTPDRVAMRTASEEVANGRRVIDFSGDYRAPDPQVYSEYASRLGLEVEHLSPDILESSAYGVPELHRDAIGRALVVANPGCLAVGCILALAPAVREGLIDVAHITCDAKTGISGAGKKPRAHFHYPEVYENTFAYRLTGHQHVLEIETQLGLLHGSDVAITFTPHVVPMARGILSTCYAPMADGVDHSRVLRTYADVYAGEPFVTVYDRDGPSGTVIVRGSNRVNLIVACDERTGVFRVVSHIDNLMKGQSGSAVQNMNVMLGLEETSGLRHAGAHP